MTSRRRWLWLILALIAYYLPWVYHRSAGLTFNANDLAEWNSLALRAMSAPLVVPFLLRVMLAFLALLFGLSAACAHRDIGRWGFAVLAIILVITSLPPAEFFKGAWNDGNYLQQFVIAVVAAIGLIIIAWRRVWILRYQRRLEIALVLLAAICAVVGDVAALAVVRAYRIDESLGGGLVVFVASLGLYLFAQMRTAN